jgi:hypothetical protein
VTSAEPITFVGMLAVLTAVVASPATYPPAASTASIRRWPYAPASTDAPLDTPVDAVSAFTAMASERVEPADLGHSLAWAIGGVVAGIAERSGCASPRAPKEAKEPNEGARDIHPGDAARGHGHNPRKILFPDANTTLDLVR